MNKKLVAAALGLAFAAPVFADSSNVTLYGRVHSAIVNQSTDGPGAAQAGGSMALENYSSRFGIKGQEDLGGGLSAIFAYEFAIDSDANDQTAAGGRAAGQGGLQDGRHAYIGLKGSYGTFMAGTLDGGNESVAPLYNQASAILGSPNNNAGDLTNVGGGATAAGGDPAAEALGDANGFRTPISRVQRTNNSFGYKTSVAGVNIQLRHALGGTNDVQAPGAGIKENDLRQTEIAADYKIGALTLAAGYADIDRSEAQQTLADAVTGEVDSIFQIGANYNFGALTVGALYGQVELNRPTAAGRDDSNSQFALSANYALTGNSGVYGFYADSEEEHIAANAERTQALAAYYYDFSKRTRSYVGFNRTTTDVPAVGEADTDSFVVGLRHNF
jgi:predicted porin